MTERDYMLVMNLTKLSMAEHLLRKMVLDRGSTDQILLVKIINRVETLFKRLEDQVTFEESQR